MSQSARPPRTPTPRRNEYRASAIDFVRGAGARLRRLSVHSLQFLARTWRSSLQFRVVSTTMVLGLVVILLLGSYLYQSISRGLEQDRIASASIEASGLASEAQQAFDATDSTESAADLGLFARDLVQQKLASPGTDQSRQVILTRSKGNTSSVNVATVLSGNQGLPTIPEDIRDAVNANPRRQQIKLIGIDDPETNEAVPAVLVGSQIELPLAGKYDLYFIFPMQREEQTLALITNTFAFGGVALVLLVGAVAWVVTRQVVIPVRRAAVVAERLSSGRLNERMSVRGEDDLAMLGKSFNEMADSLQAQIRQLEGLSRVQQRFVSDVSHELRTPLTTIRMAADLIHDSRVGFDPAVSRSAELLQNELDRFEELLADLLEISRFDAGAAALDAEATDLRDSVDHAVEAASSIAERRGSVISVKAGGDCVAEIDSRRVERILRNLVVNAVEHGEGRPVEVMVRGNETAVAVAVRDHGVGLRPGEAALVFNRFWRADPARARTTGGTGLGLAISLEDARLHEGWLQAWGEPGAGSVFRLTLPRRSGEPIDESPLPLQPDPAPGDGARRAEPAPSGQASAGGRPDRAEGAETPPDRDVLARRPL
jgi:two-component system sensor histidine kinase MtrB